MLLLPYALIFVIFYFLLIRPQSQRAKQHRAKIAEVKKNDQVITGGGLIGKVVKVDEHEVEVELAPGLKVRAVKATLSDVTPHGSKAAND